ncbi:MAG: glycine cleavage system protein T, partial [Acidobacteria bacterium]|nr:glycine cleavage system protein T [Acidobacteriota bacterium]
MSQLGRTVFYDRHKDLGAKLAPFAGWEMPIHYTRGIVAEHLATRSEAGLFDVSHMGRFVIRGRNALPFLQCVLSNNAESLDIPEVGAQYAFIPNATGGAVDDAFLYRFVEDEYILVVNAANRQKDWDHLREVMDGFVDIELTDRTEEVVMLALQGPMSRRLLEAIIESGTLPPPMRNAVGTVRIGGAKVTLARTGYTGEPICFELFMDLQDGPAIWDLLVEKGATPIGLGARDSLRLEAGLPLYGHELGVDPEGREIPVMACPLSKFAVSFSPLKGDYVGRAALMRQRQALQRIIEQDYSLASDLPRRFYPVALLGRGIARGG